MQLLERPWGIAVHGSASVRAVPDLARIRFRISRSEQTPAAAYASATDAVQAARNSLRSHAVPDASVQHSRLDLRTSWNYDTGVQTFQGYECQAAFAVETTGLDEVHLLLIDLVAAGVNEIEGVDFDLSNRADLLAQARTGAVQAARRNAEVYAQAAGVRLGAVVHIEDVDQESGGGGQYRSVALKAGGDASGDLAPGSVVVQASVVLGFAIAREIQGNNK